MVNMLRCFILGLALLSGAAWAEKVTVLSYYDHPPFLERDGGGLSKELCDWLNNKSQGRYQFELQVVPRLRLDAMLRRSSGPILVLWVSPDFFADSKNFQWGGVLMSDSVVMLTMPGSAIDLDRPDTLRGLRFGGVLGHHYNFGGLAAALKSGQLMQVNGQGPAQNYTRLTQRRIDMTIMPESAAHYLHSQLPAGQAAPQEQQLASSIFHRTYFSLGAGPALSQFIQSELDEVRVVRGTQPAWRLQARQH